MLNPGVRVVGTIEGYGSTWDVLTDGLTWWPRHRDNRDDPDSVDGPICRSLADFLAQHGPYRWKPKCSRRLG